MSANTEYDVLVIGGGPAGENAADHARRGGHSVGLIERELLGGECSYWACMPSKALLRPGEVLRAAQRVPGARQAVTGTIDVEAALRRRNSLSAHWNDAGQVEWLESVEVDLIRGHGRLAGVRLVDVQTVDGDVVRYEAARAVVLATGSGAAHPPIEGLGDTRSWDNRAATTATEVPRRLLVLGGGVVGVEMAQAWKDLGANEVTLVEMLPRLIHREEPFAGEELKTALEARGIQVLVDTKLLRVERSEDSAPVVAHLDGGQTIEADELLVAVGRKPLTDDLGLETVGLEPGRPVAVDDRMLATGVDGDWLYAVGDINGRALLTHTGKYQARVAGDRIAGLDARAWGDRLAVPRVVFTDPHIAAVGLTEAEAVDAGIGVQIARYGTGSVAGAATLGQGIRGTSQLVIDGDKKVIVGATFVGPGAGELLHAATIAIVGEVPLSQLWHAIPSFPTLSEVWLRLLETYRAEYGVQGLI